MECSELLNALSAQMGGAALVPDANGVVSLEIGGMTFSILDLPEASSIVLLGEVGKPPPQEELSGLDRTLLEANYNFSGTAGAALSVNPETGAVSLTRALDTRVMDADAFFAALELFVNTMESWHNIVSAYRSAGAMGSRLAADDESPADANIPNLLMSPYLCV